MKHLGSFGTDRFTVLGTYWCHLSQKGEHQMGARGTVKNTNQYFRVFRTKRRCNLQRCNMIQDLRFKGNSRNPSGCILRVWIQDSRSFPAFLKPASSSKALHCISVNYNSFEQLVFQILTPTGVWNTGLRGFGLLIRQQKLVSQRTQKLNGWTMDRFS